MQTDEEAIRLKALEIHERTCVYWAMGEACPLEESDPENQFTEQDWDRALEEQMQETFGVAD